MFPLHMLLPVLLMSYIRRRKHSGVQLWMEVRGEIHILAVFFSEGRAILSHGY